MSANSVHTGDTIVLQGILGTCGDRRVFLGFASARLLHSISFADVLNEDTGEGYQRRFSLRHSSDFATYIQKEGSSTIPLTFNLRPEFSTKWTVIEADGRAELRVANAGVRVLAQVDCQHRIGCLADVDVPLAFMTYLGLPLREEMRIFNVINGKAKGLSSSLLDHHESQLLDDVASQRPELYLAVRLDDDPRSPWFRQLDRGGTTTVGMTRRASLRTMQNAVRKFLRKQDILKRMTPDQAYEILLNFWRAVARTLNSEWRNPRKHFLTKGICVYALTALAARLVQDAAHEEGVDFSEAYFVNRLAFLSDIDWSANGPLKGLGGESGAQEAFQLLVNCRAEAPTY
ncbi:DGQHR domain-containing protein [Verrucomicrobiota bacterium sgz303538]